ncbi:Bug family tripartite tricarboxylate transporter substrate binding protein [Promicromonospora sukumoe]|uniref:Putative tricarboxylic transport membrane protein n=1 Tax=Promicromonospora sukumoe TaxID=88382 RepID=A0A7W3J804_9MICO|nr:tripartite tricarboxylate transporter substrate-binding protein [Promicromonospora sukumoe]MBA8807874.1 putative tricarboxylic transport membrane protein [Promicromonospora sukumoe]
MRRGVRTTIALLVCVPLVVAAGIQANRSGNVHGARTGLTLLVPAAPGGGWDTVAREMQSVMRERGIVTNPRVVNAGGAAGTIGLGQLMEMSGQDDVLMVTGTVMIGGIEVNDSAYRLEETTPIAHLADDYEALVVPADSPYATVDDFVEAFEKNPGQVSIGGGSIGGTDHLTAGLLAEEVGVDPADVNYIPFAGGGEAVNALLSHSVAAGMSGYNEFADQIEAGKLRILALSAPEPVADIDAPTFIEAGYDLYLPNFRGVVAPPGIAPEDAAELQAIVEETVATPEWSDAVERNKWVANLQTGEEFGDFLDGEIGRIQDVVKELGL